MYIGNFVTEDFLVNRNQVDQSSGEDLYSSSNLKEKVPETPDVETVSFIHDEGFVDEVPCDGDLVEAQITWDLGEVMGLKVSNELAMIDALIKV